MSKFKKVLALLLVVALTAALSVSLTMAYLQDDDSDVNVMTLGNVQIKQHEYERVLNADGTYEMYTSQKYGEGYKLQPFTQSKPLYPATGAITGWGTKVPFDQIEGASGAQAVFAGLNNVQDKFVLVENIGKSSAYVRTLIALEYGSNTKDIIGISTGDFWTWNGVGIAEIDSNNYYLFEAIYKGSEARHVGGILPAGEFTYNSLGQVYLASEATNEDCVALDGNKNGTYDILVVSQAVQVNGFANAETALDAAFGDITTTNHPWAGEDNVPKIPVTVSSADELKSAIIAGGDVVLAKDLTVDAPMEIPAGVAVNIDLNGNTLTGASYTTSSGTESLNNVIVNNGDLTITGSGEIKTRNIMNNPGAKLVIDGDIKIIGGNPNGGGSAIWNEGYCVIKNATIEQVNTGNYAIQNIAENSTMVIENATVVSKHGAIASVGANATLIVNGGSYEVTGVSTDHVVYVQAGSVVINGGTYNLSQSDASSYGSTIIDGAVVINGGTFNTANGALAYGSEAGLTINGGTFLNKATTVYGGNFAQFVATTSTVTTNADGSITVTAK